MIKDDKQNTPQPSDAEVEKLAEQLNEYLRNGGDAIHNGPLRTDRMARWHLIEVAALTASLLAEVERFKHPITDDTVIQTAFKICERGKKYFSTYSSAMSGKDALNIVLREATRAIHERDQLIIRNQELEASHISAVDYGVKLQRIIELEAAVARKDEALEWLMKEVNEISSAQYIGKSKLLFRQIFFRVQHFTPVINKALSPTTGSSLLGELGGLRKLEKYTHHIDDCPKLRWDTPMVRCTCGLSALLNEEGKG